MVSSGSDKLCGTRLNVLYQFNTKALTAHDIRLCKCHTCFWIILNLICFFALRYIAVWEMLAGRKGRQTDVWEENVGNRKQKRLEKVKSVQTDLSEPCDQLISTYALWLHRCQHSLAILSGVYLFLTLSPAVLLDGNFSRQSPDFIMIQITQASLGFCASQYLTTKHPEAQVTRCKCQMLTFDHCFVHLRGISVQLISLQAMTLRLIQVILLSHPCIFFFYSDQCIACTFLVFQTKLQS